jgi:KUP system potassium uptake protein
MATHATVQVGPSSLKAPQAALTLGALGVVFGDIGTSPLYTLRECLREVGDGPAKTEEVLGLLSLIFWALTMVVSVKYLSFIMRAQNRGEGGIFALLALVPVRLRKSHGVTRVSAVALLVVVGAALLYGDGAITPAISVLSALEGLTVIRPSLEHAVVPLTCVILVGLFFVQRHGTGAVGSLFGPVMALWFVTIGALGFVQIVRHPAVLSALSPLHAIHHFATHGMRGFLVLGSVVLAVTGGEALYADMGHFGPHPIRTAWLGLVMPALVLCYFGQGALVIGDPDAAKNPFFALAPSGPAQIYLVVLSSCATIIASQALISGAFSLTRQAMQLGYFPRVTVTHTAAHTEGQIYIPQINWILASACLLLVIGFQKSERLAAAYGIAVTGTMMLTSVVYYVVTRYAWGWRKLTALALLGLFLAVDVPFFLANTVKIADGGWVPVVIGIAFIGAMLIWSKGRTLVFEEYARRFGTLEEMLPRIRADVHGRTPGVAVFMTSSKTFTPPVLVHMVERMHTLPECVLLFTVATTAEPVVDPSRRLEIVPVEDGFYRIVARYGFMEHPDVPAMVDRALTRAKLPFREEDVTYFLGRERVLGKQTGAMGRFAENLFGYLQRNAVAADLHFGIPPNQVIEVGIQLDL